MRHENDVQLAIASVFLTSLLVGGATLLADDPIPSGGGGPDKEQSAFEESDWTGVYAVNHVVLCVDHDTQNPSTWTIKKYLAASSLIQSHVNTYNSSNENVNYPHWHIERELFFDPPGQHLGNYPTGVEVDTYWDARFGQAFKETSQNRIQQTCYEWGMTTAGGRGTYAYIIPTYLNQTPQIAPDKVLHADFDSVDQEVVAVNDLLFYAVNAPHVSLVVQTRLDGTDYKPSKIQWKYLESGIYEAEKADDDENEFNTGMNCGPNNPSETISNQNWTWDSAYHSSPNVWRAVAAP
jgi:hypothetical protein